MNLRRKIICMTMSGILAVSMGMGVSAQEMQSEYIKEYPEGLIIENEDEFIPDEGKIVCMTVDGVLQDVKEGDYTGKKVVIYWLDEMKDDLAGAGNSAGGSGGGESQGESAEDSSGEGSTGNAAGSADNPMGPPPEEQGGASYVDYRSALVIDQNEIAYNVSAVSAVRDASVLSGDELAGGTISILGSRTNVMWNEDGTMLQPEGNVPGNSDGVWDWVTDYDIGVYNGITIIDSDYRISDLKIDYEGNGGDDFHMFGTAIGVSGDSSVVLDNVDIYTNGVIATGLAVSGTSDVLVKDSNIVTKGTDNDTWYKYNEKGMTSAAWVLGGRGTVRTTNALGNATMTFWNTYAESNGWGVYSGDEAKGITQYIINSIANIPSVGEEGYEEGDFAAGYGTYCLSGTKTYVLGSVFDVPDFAVIVAGGNSDHYIGSSSKENLMTFVGEDSSLYRESDRFENIEEQKSIFYSDNFGVMWHSNATGSVNFLPGSEMYAGETAFLIKGSQSLSNSPVINMENCILKDLNDDGVFNIVHLFESDDAGQTDEISLHHDYKWAIAAQYLGAEKTRLDGDLRATVTANFKDMELCGDCWNSVYTARQMLKINLDNTTLEGTVSSADVEHRNKSYLYAYNENGDIICTDLTGKAYKTLYTDPYTATTMNGTSTTTVYIYPERDEEGAFVYDEEDTNVYDSCGYAVFYTDAQYLGLTDETASETLNNPVGIYLKNGSCWTVTGTGYLSELSLEEGCVINGTVTVDGENVDVSGGGEWSGMIVVEALN